MDGTECQILLDTGASKSFMSKSYNLTLQSFTFTTKCCIENMENSSRQWTAC